MIGDFSLEHKFARLETVEAEENVLEIKGYASLFGMPDQGQDVVSKGAFAKSLAALIAADRQVKMLWQHDPTQPIGVWDEVYEDDKGLFVKGRLLPDVPKAAEEQSLLKAGALDGLSIGYRVGKSHKNDAGQRVLDEVELWEVSLVTFPMLPEAKVQAKSKDQDPSFDISEITRAFEEARVMLADPLPAHTTIKGNI